jgi:hypothetical protein
VFGFVSFLTDMFSPGSSKKIENENGVKGKDDAKSHFFI